MEHFYLEDGTEIDADLLEYLPDRTPVWWWIEGRPFMAQQRRGDWQGFVLYPTGVSMPV